jgi:hypothetical protein
MTQFDQAKNDDINTTRSFTPCPDSNGLGGPSGYDSEVHGPDSEEVLNFAPTRNELIHLVKHWAAIVIGHRFYQQPGSSESRCEAFAGRRIDRIATVLGEEAVEKAINEAEEEFSKTVSPPVWWIFKNSTKVQWLAFLDEVDEDLRSWKPVSEEEKGADGR